MPSNDLILNIKDHMISKLLKHVINYNKIHPPDNRKYLSEDVEHW